MWCDLTDLSPLVAVPPNAYWPNFLLKVCSSTIVCSFMHYSFRTEITGLPNLHVLDLFSCYFDDLANTVLSRPKLRYFLVTSVFFFTWHRYDFLPFSFSSPPWVKT